MSKVVLLDYENDHDYKLVGLHTPLEDFRLAFLLNKKLTISLSRFYEDLDFEASNTASYSLYTFNCENSFTNWSLIANKYDYISDDSTQLFSKQQKTSILIKEKKQVDYFLKIEGEININDIISNINSIKNIITSYSINPQTLKSKDFLIF